VGKYLDILDRAEAKEREISEISEKSYNGGCTPKPDHSQQDTFFRLIRFSRTFSELERRCPDHVEPSRWQQAVEDSRRFLAQWGEQAEHFGWTPRDLFGLHKIPAKPHPSYRRLSRYDCTGLIWLLRGCPVVALTESTVAIRMPTGSILTYRKHNKPALGPLGDSLDDFGG
jgi:hypothetical protein